MPPRAMAAQSSSVAAALQSQIVQLCEQHGGDGGVSKDFIEQSLSEAPREALLGALNTLLTSSRLKMSQTSTGTIQFELQSEATASRIRVLDGLSAEDRLIYQEIERSGDSGIRSKDLRVRSNLQQQQVAKVLRTLESRGLVRSVKSIAAKNQKLYILAGLEPSAAVTGGTWYTDEQTYDHALVEILQNAAYDFIARSKTISATAQQVLDFINRTGLVRGKPLAVGDIDAILQSLVYDARLEITRGVSSGPGEARTYKLLEMSHDFAPHHVHVPCSICPMFDVCAPDAEINPQSCEYIARWLSHPGAPAGSGEELSW